MTFPADIKVAMRDCVLSLIWPKKDIVNFFRANSCTESDIKILGDIASQSRSQIIDRMFSHLDSKADEGLGPFRAMLQSLTGWSTFDSYYFDTIKKLDRARAERSVSHLRQLQEIRDHRLKEERREREKREAERQAPKLRLPEIRQKFVTLLQGEITGAKRGYALEEILRDLSKLSGLETTDPFRVNGEQIDGSLKYDGEHYIVEAKWQDKSAANESVYQFAGKIEGKMYGRGIFVSVHGYSENVVRSLVSGKAIKTVFVDGADLTMVVEGYLSFDQMLDRKIKAAQTKGEIYIDAVTGKPKIT